MIRCEINHQINLLEYLSALLLMSRQSQIFTRSLSQTILRSILQIVISQPDLCKAFSLLGRVASWEYSKGGKQKRFRCIKCQGITDGLLLLILHLQLEHKESLCVTKYEFYSEMMIIHTANPTNNEEMLLKNAKDGMTLVGAWPDRPRKVLFEITSKFVRKNVQKRVYYHSTDIFREVGQDSADEDSQDEVGQIELQLQRMRISQFTDVNQHDKLFFTLWNQAIHTAKQTHSTISKLILKNILMEFVQTAKKHNLQRINLVMHAWTLWSGGKISKDDVKEALKSYDRRDNEENDRIMPQ